jgi:hypothetical protein
MRLRKDPLIPISIAGVTDLQATVILWPLTVSAVKWFKHLDLRVFIFRALFCVSLVLKVISFDRVAVLICSVAIFC